MTEKEKTPDRTEKLLIREMVSELKDLNRVLLGDQYSEGDGLIHKVKKNSEHRHKVERIIAFGKWIGVGGIGTFIASKWHYILDKFTS